MLGEARAGGPVRTSPSMLGEYLAPYATALAELTIAPLYSGFFKQTISAP
jgi:hypothetical protein